MGERKNEDLLRQIKKVRQYGFWLVIIILTILTIRDIIDLVIEYQDNPTQSEMKMIVNESMTMPNITFCMSKRQAWSHFKVDSNEIEEEQYQIIQDQLANMTDAESFLKTNWDNRFVMEAYKTIAFLNSLERESTPNRAAREMMELKTGLEHAKMRKMIRTWMDAIKERNVTFDQFTYKTGTEVLKRSIRGFARLSYDENRAFKTKMKISWISMMNLCFQPEFDANNFDNIEDQGQFFKLMTLHQIHENETFDCMAVDFHGRPNPVGRFFENKEQAQNGITDKLCLGNVYEVTVHVDAAYTMLQNDEPGTACNALEEGEDTEFDCRSRCRMEMIKQMCNCIAPTLSYLKRAADEDLPICDYEKCEIDDKKMFTDEVCANKCLRDCQQIRYELRVDRKGRAMRPDFTSITLLWGSFEYLSLEQQFVWTVTTFIAALGGAFGMWLGLSILDNKVIRIYTDGVYDLFHPGHTEQLRQAKEAFPRVHLIVGVCSDADTLEVKKCLPIMNETERVNMIKQCKYVDEVYPCPPFFPTLEFVNSLKVDLVAHDAIPYSSPDSPDCYEVFKLADRFLETIRTPEISTTALLNRILNNIETIRERQAFRCVSE